MPYSIDSQTLRKAAADWQAISDGGYQHRFHEELGRRLRCDDAIYSQLYGNSLPFGSEFWADSFAKELAGILDAPIAQVKGAAIDMLPLTKRKIALQLLSELAVEVSVKNAASRKVSYPRRAS